jgi:hypothetical protein
MFGYFHFKHIIEIIIMVIFYNENGNLLLHYYIMSTPNFWIIRFRGGGGK